MVTVAALYSYTFKNDYSVLAVSIEFITTDMEATEFWVMYSCVVDFMNHNTGK